MIMESGIRNRGVVGIDPWIRWWNQSRKQCELMRPPEHYILELFRGCIWELFYSALPNDIIIYEPEQFLPDWCSAIAHHSFLWFCSALLTGIVTSPARVPPWCLRLHRYRQTLTDLPIRLNTLGASMIALFLFLTHLLMQAGFQLSLTLRLEYIFINKLKTSIF